MKKRDFKSPEWLILHPKYFETHFGNRNPSLREDVKKKISEASRRMWAKMSKEKRKEIAVKKAVKMSGDNNPSRRPEAKDYLRRGGLWHKGRKKGPMSPEHREKNRLGHLGKKYSPEQNARNAEIQRNRTKETCAGRRSAALKMSGDNNPSKRLEVKEKKKETCLKNHGFDSYSKTDEFRVNSTMRMKNGGASYANSFIKGFSKEFREKRREHMLNGGASHANSFIKNPSKPQVQLFEQTKILYPSTILNYPYLNYSIDIAIPDQKIAIEYDGSRWHQNIEKDKKRQSKLELDGWNFIRYKDYVPSSDELLKDISKMVSAL